MPKNSEHKESEALVKVIYYPSKTLSDGSHPFVVRITKKRQRKYVMTGLALHPQYWNKETNDFRKNVPANKQKEMRAAFKVWEEKYSQAAEELTNADEQYEAKTVAAIVVAERVSKRKFKLLAYFDDLISQFDKTGNVGNRKVYRDVRNNLQRFVGESQDVTFDSITVKFCNEWEHKMKAEGLTGITLSVKFRTLRAVFNKAIANGYAKSTSYPFARNTAETNKFQIGKFDTKTTKRAISKKDIREIEKFQPEPYHGPYASLRDTTDRQLLARDLFLFSYYCGGINFVDMAALTWANVITDLHGHERINYTRQKTGGKLSIRLIDSALKILEHYKPSENLHATSYIFPILNPILHKTAMQKHNRSSKIMSQVNADLKIIGEATGIKTPLTTYVARHSFATSLRMAGQDVAVISQAMGHNDEATTRIYLKELGTELIDAAFDDL